MSYFFNNFSPRQIHLIIFLIVGSLLGYAAYSMKILGLEPCTLCLTQQFFYCLIGISSFVAFLHNPKINFSKLYSIFLSLFALAGCGFLVARYGFKVFLKMRFLYAAHHSNILLTCSLLLM